MQKVLLAALAVGLAGSAHAQTHAPARPAPRPAAKATAAHRAAALPTTRPAAPAATTMLPPAAETAPAAAEPQAAPAAATSRAASSQGYAGTLNLGIGFGTGIGSLGATSGTPALSVSYMHQLATAGPGTISAGGLLGYQGLSWQSGSEKATLHNTYLGVRGAYHYSFGNPRLDTYAGLGLGVRILSFSDNLGSSSASGSQVELGGFVGARYFFAERLGAFAEAGFDTSYLKVGLSARF